LTGFLDVSLIVTCYLGRVGIFIFVSYNSHTPLIPFQGGHYVYSRFYNSN